MQLYKHNTSRDGTHKQARSRSVDAALFAEELAEIYIAPTYKDWREAKKVKTILIDWEISFTMAGSLYLYPGLLAGHSIQNLLGNI